jgi:DmsE family decaheme c-type cytochrome
LYAGKKTLEPSFNVKRALKNLRLLIGVTFLYSLCVSYAVAGDAQSDEKEQYSRKGADTCLKCHDEYYKYPILPIFYTKHGNPNDPRSPMAQLQCESCHGPGRAHATEPKFGEERAPIISFGRSSWVSKEKQNQQCLQCHNGGSRMAWKGSAHESQDMLCVDCHKLHMRHDPVLAKKQEAETCYKCHTKQRAQFARNSVHPVRYGKMQCSQCHNPHGTFSDALLKTNTSNDTCYVCHAEKRGPFLWAHPPVSEDCGLCHEHHGSIHAPLLKARAPLLCQRCHSASGHPSGAYDSSRLPSGSPSGLLLANSCMNCHYQVHGSNHPGGSALLK